MATIEYFCERTEDQGTKGKIEMVNCLCSKVDPEQYTCTVYDPIPPFYQRRRCCPFNQPVRNVTKKRRVGQQKQKKGW